MKKPAFLTLGLLLCVFCLYCTNSSTPPASSKSSEKRVIGVLQFGTHEVMDAVTQGIIDRTSVLFGDSVAVEVRNGHFDRESLNTLSEELSGGAADVVVTVSTPASSAYLSVGTGNKPVVFTFVTEPKQLGYNGPGSLRLTTGLSNKTDFVGTYELIRALTPKVKKLGYLVTSTEPNASYILKAFQRSAGDFGFALKVAEISSPADVEEAGESLAGSVDAFLVGGDHAVVNAIDSLLQVARVHRLPIYSVDGSTVRKGCLAASTIDFHEMGERTAEYVAFILAGSKPEDLPVEDFARFHALINRDALNRLGIALPLDLRRRVALVP
jgi:putative tryptophan/tyrosine transport system substrate-binding protein